MINLILAMVVVLISAIAKSNCDKKAFREGGVEPSNGRGWIVKTALSFLLGKWHRWDAIRVMVLCIGITLLGGLSWYYIVIFYTVHGLVFELNYNIKSIWR